MFAAIALLVGANIALTQIATVDASDPTSPNISWDQDPYLYAPEIPDYPLVVYPDSGSGAVSNTTGQYTSQEPVIITSEPDTYSLTKATIYYTAPTEPAGPFVTPSTPIPLKFDFGPGPVATGYTQVLETTGYTPAMGYGWGDVTKVGSRDRGGDDPLARDFCLPAGTPFYVDLANGYYDITVLTGDTAGKSSMAVRADGALEFYGLSAPAGAARSDTFRFKVTRGRVRLEFFGSVCHVNAITLTPTPQAELDKTTIYLASDSTVSKYGPEVFPLTGWGVPLQNYFTSDVVVSNQAKPGRSSKSFFEEGSLAAIDNTIKAGDYLFVMFAINDSADDSSNRKTKPESSFKAYLRQYVAVARNKGAIPVFVTAQIKRTYDLWGRFFNSVQGYPQAMRDLGAELGVPVVDLNRLSIGFLTAIGPEAAKNTYMYLAAGEYPGWPDGDSDYIHLQYNGADQMARLVTQGIQEINLQPLASRILNARPWSGPRDGPLPMGTTIAYDSTGFEAPAFLPLQPLAGQRGWQKDAGGSDGSVLTNDPNGGLQAVRLLRPVGDHSDTHWWVNTPVSAGEGRQTVGVALDLRVNMGGLSAGPAFGLNAYNGATLLGGFAIDASTGDLFYVNARTGAATRTGAVLTRDTYHHCTLALDFQRRRYSIFIDDLLYQTERFSDSQAGQFSGAALTTFALDPSNAAIATGTAYVDNYIVVTR
jgi:lysophospholipase L1-like esterase